MDKLLLLIAIAKAHMEVYTDSSLEEELLKGIIEEAQKNPDFDEIFQQELLSLLGE